ncbi:MAG: S-methyl-5-thioribose-1-phosphate isomerase [Kiritimatiellia bacterium]
MKVLSIEWISNIETGVMPGFIRMIDQTKLPVELVYLDTTDIKVVWEAIKTLRVRGAPAIGVAAAMGVAAALQDSKSSGEKLLHEAEKHADYLATSRPTAVNLFWALERMKKVARENSGLSPEVFKERMVREAIAIRDEDAAMCRAIGEHGVKLIKDGQTVLTHCNAGALAVAEYGSGLAPIYAAQARGMKVRVFADETRPILQGARLTAWELMQAGIDVTLICDNTAAVVMKEGRIDLVMVGSDRIAANGDAANKIGSYGVARLARAHGIPMYFLAPTSTIDMSIPSGDCIPIEERGADEVTCGFGRRTAPEGVKVYSPAFDVTPAEFITAIVTEKGIAYPPFGEKLQEWML